MLGRKESSRGQPDYEESLKDSTRMERGLLNKQEVSRSSAGRIEEQLNILKERYKQT